MTDTDSTRMTRLEQRVSDDLDEATAIELLHPAWAPTLDPVQDWLRKARDKLHAFNTGAPSV